MGPEDIAGAARGGLIAERVDIPPCAATVRWSARDEDLRPSVGAVRSPGPPPGTAPEERERRHSRRLPYALPPEEDKPEAAPNGGQERSAVRRPPALLRGRSGGSGHAGLPGAGGGLAQGAPGPPGAASHARSPSPQKLRVHAGVGRFGPEGCIDNRRGSVEIEPTETFHEDFSSHDSAPDVPPVGARVPETTLVHRPRRQRGRLLAVVQRHRPRIRARRDYPAAQGPGPPPPQGQARRVPPPRALRRVHHSLGQEEQAVLDPGLV